MRLEHRSCNPWSTVAVVAVTWAEDLSKARAELVPERVGRSARKLLTRSHF